ncbi:hypothetical protein THRCLA_21684 [Thraustotheca clavata]|uniref:Uncharacterized protein n=1 Tax=Thraustotheca clavata TaxID=74557 RepID=A0A1V9ZR63_9STRA|nr:hypothetical protein THRCLA_21684 [Thraustotheca clavata]
MMHLCTEIIDPVASPVNLNLNPTALSNFKTKRTSSLTQLSPEAPPDCLHTATSTADLSLQGRHEAPEDAVYYSTGLYNAALEVLAQACAIDDHEVMLEISMF